jgi:hypothetical protein
MLNREIIKNRKRSEISVEMCISIALAVVVLFVVVGLFNNNLQAMVASSNMSNMWNNTQKTTYSTQTEDPTKNSAIGSQVNVQVLAEQGGLNTLDDYINAAIANVDYYDKNPPTTEDSVEDLAKCLTILKMTKGITVYDQHDGTNLATTHGIKITINNVASETKVLKDTTTGLVINKQFEYAQGGTINLRSPDDQLTVAKEIKTVQYSPITSS